MDDEVLKKYRKAGRIAGKAREHGKKMLKKGTSYKEVVESTENRIRELGGEIAFPTNLSIGSAGAHDTADVNEERTLESGLAKIDVGVHVDGWIGDTATTVSLDGKDEEMIEAAEAGLEAAIGMMKPGNKVKDVSAKIEKAIRDHGYTPITNLTGHGLDKYDLHAKLQIPNVKNEINYELEKGDVFAIEPFATDGAGKVNEGNKTLIYCWQKDKSVRSRQGRKILKMAKNEYHKLPFAKRWLTEEISPLRLNMALRQLAERGALYKYPVLKEAEGGNVAQAEHTILVGEEPEILTKV
ncbi:MAG: type II methionyl aminopeptidase [Candidatus Aenigmatarchaeota archaeon]